MSDGRQLNGTDIFSYSDLVTVRIETLPVLEPRILN